MEMVKYFDKSKFDYKPCKSGILLNEPVSRAMAHIILRHQLLAKRQKLPKEVSPLLKDVAKLPFSKW